MLHFPHIAWLAKGLSICLLVPAAAHDRNYVVQNEVVRSVTPETFITEPHFSLTASKSESVTLQFSRLVAGRVSSKHLVSVIQPAVTQRCADLGPRFCCMP